MTPTITNLVTGHSPGAKEFKRKQGELISLILDVLKP
jgi:hypothetical protein